MAETGGSDIASVDTARNDAIKTNECIFPSAAPEDEQASKHQQSDVSEQLNLSNVEDVTNKVSMTHQSRMVDNSLVENPELFNADKNLGLLKNSKDVEQLEKASDDACVERQIEHNFGEISENDVEQNPQDLRSKEKVVSRKPYDGCLVSEKDGPMNAVGMLGLGMHFVSESLRRPLPDEVKHLSCGLHILMTKWLNSSTVNRMTLKNFHISKQIGHGGYANVYLAFFDKRPVALKQYLPNISKPEDIFKERDIMLHLDHENVRKLLGAFYEGHSYLVMELCVGTVAQARLKANKARIHFWILQLLQAVEYIHSKEIIHCDIKPSNCLVTTSGCLKLSDFSASMILPKGATAIQCHRSFGLAAYQDAETNEKFIHSKSKDIFSLACTLYEIETQRGLLKYVIPSVKPTTQDYVDAYNTGRQIIRRAKQWNKPTVEKMSLVERAAASNYSEILKLMIFEPRIGAKEALENKIWKNSFSQMTTGMLTTGIHAPNAIKFDSSVPIEIYQSPKIDVIFQIMSALYYDSEKIIDRVSKDENAYKAAERTLVKPGETDVLAKLKEQLAAERSKIVASTSIASSVSDKTFTEQTKNAEESTTHFNEKRATEQSLDGTNAEELDPNPDSPLFTQRSAVPKSAVNNPMASEQLSTNMQFVDLADILHAALLNVFQVRIPVNSAGGVASALASSTMAVVHSSQITAPPNTSAQITAAPTTSPPTFAASETALATSVPETSLVPTPKTNVKNSSKAEANVLTGMYKDLVMGPVPSIVDSFKLPSKNISKGLIKRDLSPLREADGVAPEARTIIPKGAKRTKQRETARLVKERDALVRTAPVSMQPTEDKSSMKRKATARGTGRENETAKKSKTDDQNKKRAEELRQQKFLEAEEKSRQKREAERKRLGEVQQKQGEKKKGKGSEPTTRITRSQMKRIIEESEESEEGEKSDESKESEEEEEFEYQCHFCKYRCEDEKVVINHMKRAHPETVKVVINQARRAHSEKVKELTKQQNSKKSSRS